MLNKASAIESVRQINIQHSTLNIQKSTFFYDDHKIFGDGGDDVTDAVSDF